MIEQKIAAMVRELDADIKRLTQQADHLRALLPQKKAEAPTRKRKAPRIVNRGASAAILDILMHEGPKTSGELVARLRPNGFRSITSSTVSACCLSNVRKIARTSGGFWYHISEAVEIPPVVAEPISGNLAGGAGVQ